MNKNRAMIIFQPSGLRGSVPVGISIIEASRRLGVDIEALCGDKQVCGKCKVRIEEGVFEKYGIKSKWSHAGPWQDSEDRHINAAEKNRGIGLGVRPRSTVTCLFLFRKYPGSVARW